MQMVLSLHRFKTVILLGQTKSIRVLTLITFRICRC